MWGATSSLGGVVGRPAADWKSTSPLDGTSSALSFELRLEGAVATSGLATRLWRHGGWASPIICSIPRRGGPRGQESSRRPRSAAAGVEAETLAKTALLSGRRDRAGDASLGSAASLILDDGEVHHGRTDCGPSRGASELQPTRASICSGSPAARSAWPRWCSSRSRWDSVLRSPDGCVRAPGRSGATLKAHARGASLSAAWWRSRGMAFCCSATPTCDPGLGGIALPFALGSQPAWTGVGIIAGWLAAIIGLSFYVRHLDRHRRLALASPLDTRRLRARRRPHAGLRHRRQLDVAAGAARPDRLTRLRRRPPPAHLSGPQAPSRAARTRRHCTAAPHVVARGRAQRFAEALGAAAVYRRVDAGELDLLDAYWRAANYLSVGQIYLLDNPLLRRPLEPEDVKSRLLGHWGTTPGLNFVYAHMNRAIRDHDLNAIYVTGPGPRRPRAGGATPTSRAPTARSTRASGRTRRGSGASSASSRSPAASRATWRRRRRAPSTRAASWGTRSPTPTGPRSTTRTCSSAAWSGRRGRDGPAGNELALEQVRRPAARRRRAARPAPERLQDRQPDGARPPPARGAGGAAHRVRARAALRRGERPGRDARVDGAGARPGGREHPQPRRRPGPRAHAGP